MDCEEILKKWGENGFTCPNPDNVEFLVTKFSENSQALEIMGKNLEYVQLGETHHGCQCNLNGGHENHKLITDKLSEICKLFTEINELNIREDSIK